MAENHKDTIVQLSDPYIPTEQDLWDENTPEVPGPVLKAARNPDSRILAALLEDGRFNPNDFTTGFLHGHWASALTQAILNNLPSNVNLLLEHGANPNGYTPWCFDLYSSSFIRHRPQGITHTRPVGSPKREIVLSKLQEPQTGPITAAEISSRYSSRARFWAEVGFPSTKKLRYQIPPLTALEAAASSGSIEILHRLEAAGADTSAWKQQCDAVPAQPTPSHLAVFTPLHHAIVLENSEMVRELLEMGYNPNVFPMAAITRSQNAAMLAVSKPSPWTAGLQLVASHTDFSLATPIYNCNILHFATAQLNLDLLKQVVDITKVSIRGATPTALGHTLLHIACLPYDDLHVNTHAPSIYESIHEMRTLSESWMPSKLWPHQPRRNEPPAATRLRRQVTSSDICCRPVPESVHNSQRDVVLYLLQMHGEAAGELQAQQDVHGNTALHYLASSRYINKELLNELVRVAETYASEKDCKNPDESNPNSKPNAWNGIRNRWGHTAIDLYEAGLAAKGDWELLHMPFWRDPMGVWAADGETWIDWYKYPGKLW